eukprot:gene5527-5513_t
MAATAEATIQRPADGPWACDGRPRPACPSPYALPCQRPDASRAFIKDNTNALDRPTLRYPKGEKIHDLGRFALYGHQRYNMRTASLSLLFPLVGSLSCTGRQGPPMQGVADSDKSNAVYLPHHYFDGSSPSPPIDSALSRLA